MKFMHIVNYVVVSLLLLSCSSQTSLEKVKSEAQQIRNATTDNFIKYEHKLPPLLAIEQQPNILWIITDDQRADSIAAFNQTQRGTSESALGYVLSPNIDKLAAEGVMFTHAYTNSPACAPSRASMQFGLYPHRSGRFGFEYFHNQHDRQMPTTSMSLKNAGYQTTLFGKRGVRLREWSQGKLGRHIAIYDEKIDYQHDLAKKLFTDYARIDTYTKDWVKTASHENYVFADGRVETLDQSKVDSTKPTKVEKELDILRSYTRSQKKLIIGGVSPQPAGKTLDGYILQSFLDFLTKPDQAYDAYFGRKIKGPDSQKPQMFNVGFHFPHTPVLPPKSFREKFAGRQYKVPEFDRAEVEKLPAQMKQLYLNLTVDALTPEEKQQAIADYYAFCAYGDHLIGQAVDAFKAYSQKQGRDYIILLTIGDHGWQLGEQGIEAKFSPWNTSNQGIIVAVDSRHNRFPEGKVYNEFVEYVDIAPTLLQASGIDIKRDKPQLDGYDLAEVIRKPSLQRDYVIGELNAIVGPRAYLRSKDFAFSMRVRKQNGFPGKGYSPGENIDWAYIASDEELEMGLYDLRCDGNEQNNVAYSSRYTGIVRFFRKKLTDIVIGDGRLEIDWSTENVHHFSELALGAHDGSLEGLKSIDLPDCV